MKEDKSIKFLESIKPGKVQLYDTIGGLNLKYERKLKEAIELLERSKVYKQIWEDLMRALKTGKIYTLLPEGLPDKGMHITTLRFVIENLEKKYFPKPTKLNKTLELIKEVDRDVHELLEILEGRMVIK